MFRSSPQTTSYSPSILPLAASVALALATLAQPALAKIKTQPAPTPAPIPDKTGTWSNFPAAVDQTGPFFQSLGSNGRTCATCHAPNDGWTSTPGALQKRFTATSGADPIFLSLDGTNCPTLPVATLAQHQAASSLLLNKGLIRVALTPPAGAEFSVSSVTNPYGCSSTSQVSVYRRILSTSNLAFLSNVMWDGRESAAASVYGNLVSQANDAVATHAAGTAPASPATVSAVVAFELEQFTAQLTDNKAGNLTPGGGPVAASSQAFTPGENLGAGSGAAFNLYQGWENLVVTSASSAQLQQQASIGRGEKLFNTMSFSITKVAGLNDQKDANGNARTVITGTCGTCHNSNNAGSHSTPLLVATGQALHPLAAGQTQDLPVITLTNNATHAVVQVTDPGAALTTGKWADIGKFKVPTLRGLSARQPYFHDGSAASLDAVVNFYNTRFNLNLSKQQHADLVAFLSAL